MNQLKFVNREEELMFLEELHRKSSSQLIVIYGRRRVGKTELVKYFSRNKQSIYFLCTKSSELLNINSLSESFSRYLKNDSLTKARIEDWESLFKLFLELKKGKEKIALILDEFPFLIELNRGVISIFQKIWDEYLKDRGDITLVLLGSSISMMETEVLGYKSPLYGRRTGQWKLKELKIAHMGEFLPNDSFEELLKTYGITGGIPLYLLMASDNKTTEERIKSLFAWKGGFLYEEAENILQQEFREPKNYKLILRAISEGKRKMGEIANDTGIDKTAISRYIEILENLDIVGHELPLLAPLKSKNRLHYIKDNYFNFWFRFIYPLKSKIEEGRNEEALSDIKKDFSQFFSRIFENICRQATSNLSFPYKLNRIGRQWGKFKGEKGKNTYEIDIVGINEDSKEILFAECKWRDKVDAEKVLEELKEKSKYVDWNNEKRTEHFAIFAKSFKNKIFPKGKNFRMFDLKDIEKIFKKRK